MIKITGPKLPRKIVVACSAGVDSMAIVDFLKNHHEVTLAYYHHGKTDNVKFSDDCEQFVKKYANDNGLDIIIGYNNKDEKPKNMSMEEFWRVKRYEFLNSIDAPVITGHHLGDVVETWVWSSMHGEGKIIPYRNKNIIRPFMTNKKEEFVSWCERKNVKWLEDMSNHEDNNKTRNFIRNVIMPNVLTVNPGIHKVIAKKVLSQAEQEKKV